MSEKVVLIVGGRSTEFDASIHSYKAFREELYEHKNWRERVAGILFVSREGQPFYIEGNRLPNDEDDFQQGQPLTWAEAIATLQKTDAYIFNLWHGNEGEDGALQGLAEILNLRGSFGSVFASSFTMNKWCQSMAISQLFPKRVKMPETLIISDEKDLNSFKEWNQRKQIESVVVKPNTMGASLMTARFDTSETDAIETLVKEILEYDRHALIQEYIKGKEFTCGVIEKNGEPCVVGVIEPITGNQFLGHEEKHLHERVKIQFHEKENPIACRIHELSKLIFRRIGIENMSRFDYLYDPVKDDLYFLEINSIPGFGNGSAFPTMLKMSGLSRLDFLEICIDNEVYRRKRKKVFKYKIEH